MERISEEILSLLSRSGKYLTITEISKSLNHTRQTTARHLDILFLSGRVSLLQHGLKKKYFIPLKKPDSKIKVYSKHIQIILKTDFTIIQANDQFLQLINATTESIVGVKLSSLLLGILDYKSILNHYMLMIEDQSCQFEEIVHFKEKKYVFEFIISKIQISKQISYILLSGKDISDKKILEDTLKQSEKNYRDLFELNYANMLIIDPDTGEILHANSAASSYYGYSIEELMDMDITSINIADPETVRNNMQKAKGKQDIRFSFQHRMKSGEIRDVEVFSAPIIREEKILLHSIIHDVTDKKKLERALLESEQQYRNVVEDQTELISRYTPDGRHIFVNNAFCRYFNKERSEILGTRFSVKFYKNDKKQVVKFLDSLPEKGNIGTIEFRIITSDGEIRWLQSNIRRITDDFGETVEYQSVSMDITRSKKVEEELRISREKYQFFVEHIPDVFWILDTETWYFTYVSPSVVRLRGFTVEEIMSRPADYALNPEEAASIRSLYKTRIDDFLQQNGESPFYRREVEELCKDGSTIWTEIISYLYLNKKSGKLEIHGVSRDISERKRRELSSIVQ